MSTVIGFPHGTTTSHVKLEEAKEAVQNGAVELDVVLNISKLKSGDYTYVQDDLAQIVDYAHTKNAKVKVIFENCYLSQQEIIEACNICNKVKPDWIKTSTGFGTGGATDNDILIMKEYISSTIQLKASGGIKTLEHILKFKELGCTRVGTSSTSTICN